MLLKNINLLFLICYPLCYASDVSMSDQIDSLVNLSIYNKQIPGAVVIVGKKNNIIYKKAFGSVNKETIFDIASLTKVFTALSIMILHERGLIDIDASIKTYVPEFIHDQITIKQILLHTSGLPAANHLDDYKHGKDIAIKKICEMPLGELKFSYSCTGYILLGHIIEKISGTTLDNFMYQNIFLPLDMKSTFFNPDKKIWSNIAPTENGLKGKVHDPRSAALDGIAGNAGIFSNIDDITILCELIINNGTYNNCKIISPETVSLMIDKYDVKNDKYRGLGWDIKTEFSSCMGNFKLGTIAHTGFTGTSIVIDPTTKTFIIILTNRINMPNSSVVSLRKKIANIVSILN